MSKDSSLSSRITQLDKGALKRVLGVGDLFAVGYGDLGSSIYYALGVTALYALGATPIALALAGVVFICTALTYAEMTATFHESGGSASLARHAFNDLISFIAGWGLLLDYVVTIAISAFAVGPYLSYFYPDLKVVGVQIGFTIGIIFLLFIINFFGVKQSTRMSFILTGLTLLSQVVILFIGALLLVNLPLIWDHLRIGVPHTDWSPSWPDFWKGMAMAMVAYTGIESIAQLGAEAKRPSKTCPRAILITMTVLIVMYLGISTVALSALPAKELGTTYVQDPIAGIVSALPWGKSILGPFVGIVAAALLFVAANAGLMGASRLSFNLGEYYQLPRFFYRLHSRFRTPFVSLLFFAGTASLVVLWSRGKIDFLADLYNFGAMIAFFFAHLSLIVMRIKRPDLKRPFLIPFNIRFRYYKIPVTAVLGCIATLGVWILIVITKPDGRNLGLAWIGFGLVMYFLYRRFLRIKATGQLAIEKIKMPEFKPLKIKSILLPIKRETHTESVQMACELAKLHGAHITAINVIEVASSIPLEMEMTQRVLNAEANLKGVEAIAREFNISTDLQIIRARSIPEAVLDLLKSNKYDLVILGSMKTPREAAHKGVGAISEKILKESPCRVWLCGPNHIS